MHLVTEIPILQWNLIDFRTSSLSEREEFTAVVHDKIWWLRKGTGEAVNVVLVTVRAHTRIYD